MDFKGVDKASKAKRINRACDNCRRKKVRCDGLSPCKCCIHYKSSCIYSPMKERKKRGAFVGNERKKDHRYGDRLNRLEDMVQKMMSNKNPIPSQCITTSAPIISTTITDQRSLSIVSSEPVFGVCSTLNLFSRAGFQWINDKTNEALRPLIDIESIVQPVHTFYLQMLKEPSSRGLERLPSKEDITLLLPYFYKHCESQLLPIMDQQEVQTLFDKLFVGKLLTYSEHFAINIVLAISVLTRINAEYPQDKTSLACLNLFQQENNLVMNAIYYYHRCCIICDSLYTIQGMLLLAMYLSSSCSPRSNNAIIATAVRFGQEMGLHLKETCNTLSAADSFRRKRLWWWCYRLDKSKSFRYRNPSSIDDQYNTVFDDFTAFFQNFMELSEQHSNIVSTTLRCSLNIVQKTPLDKMFVEICGYRYGVRMIIAYHDYKLSTLYNEVHRKLYSKDCLIPESTITDLLGMLEQWTMTLPDTMKPLNFFKLKESPFFLNGVILRQDLLSLKGFILTLHLEYYILQMTVMTIGLRHCWKSQSLGQQLSLEEIYRIHPLGGKIKASATSALEIITNTREVYGDSLDDTIMFAFFCNFFSLFVVVLMNPDRECVYSMMRAVDSYLGSCRNPYHQAIATNWPLASYLGNFFVKIAIDFFNKATGDCIDPSVYAKRLEHCKQRLTVQNQLTTGFSNYHWPTLATGVQEANSSASTLTPSTTVAMNEDLQTFFDSMPSSALFDDWLTGFDTRL